MAETLKSRYGAEIPRRIAAMIAAVHPAFPARRFVREATAGLEDLELMDRARHIASALGRALPQRYEEAVRVLLASLGPPAAKTEGVGLAPFLYLPHTLFVAERGLGHFELSMAVQRELTQRCSAEFSIRAFIERDPGRALAVLREWTRDPSVHVRRLVSEGTRPRLPWAGRLRAFQRDPRPALELLDLLKDDPEPYVRRSVANHLNDIGKDHPEILLATCRRWWAGAPEPRQALVRHALRSLVKKGDRRALAILGFRGRDVLTVEGRVRPARVPIGGRAEVEVMVRNPTHRPARAVVDLAVHFVRQRGGHHVKVFKLRALELPPRGERTLRRTLRFGDLTTRRHYPGRHPVEVLVNGRRVRIGEVLLTRP